MPSHQTDPLAHATEIAERKIRGARAMQAEYALSMLRRAFRKLAAKPTRAPAPSSERTKA